jgi:hypothetical protein
MRQFRLKINSDMEALTHRPVLQKFRVLITYQKTTQIQAKILNPLHSLK